MSVFIGYIIYDEDENEAYGEAFPFLLIAASPEMFKNFELQ